MSLGSTDLLVSALSASNPTLAAHSVLRALRSVDDNLPSDFLFELAGILNNRIYTGSWDDSIDDHVPVTFKWLSPDGFAYRVRREFVGNRMYWYMYGRTASGLRRRIYVGTSCSEDALQSTALKFTN